MTTSEATATIETLREDEAAVADRSRQVTHFVGDDCPGGHVGELPAMDIGLRTLEDVAVAEGDEVIEAALAWADHPTPANIGALHAAVRRYRGLDTAR